MGDAAAELIRKGLYPEAQFDSRQFFPQFVVPEGAAPITLEQTLQAEDQE